jgi:hypothetical protein
MIGDSDDESEMDFKSHITKGKSGVPPSSLNSESVPNFGLAATQVLPGNRSKSNISRNSEVKSGNLDQKLDSIMDGLSEEDESLDPLSDLKDPELSAFAMLEEEKDEDGSALA